MKNRTENRIWRQADAIAGVGQLLLPMIAGIARHRRVGLRHLPQFRYVGAQSRGRHIDIPDCLGS